MNSIIDLKSDELSLPEYEQESIFYSKRKMIVSENEITQPSMAKKSVNKEQYHKNEN